MRIHHSWLALALSACAAGTQGRLDRLSGSLDELAPATASSAAPELELTKLERQSYVQAVLLRHPSTRAARSAVEAALARVSGSTSLPDPMLSISLAPLSIGSSQVPFGGAVELRQRLPMPGRLSDQEEAALLRAEMERDEAEGVRRALAASAVSIFDDYQFVRSALEINRQHGELLGVTKASAEADYAAGRAPASLGAEIEMEALRILRERWALEAEAKTLTAKLNILLVRPSDAPLPNLVPHVARRRGPGGMPLEALEARAVAARPELESATRRVSEGAVMESLAEWESWPELELMTSYNSMWHDPEHRWMVGVGLSLPILPSARRGAREEAAANQRRATQALEALTLEVRAEVAEALRRLEEITAAVTLYEERMRPLARERLALVRANVDAALVDYRSLIEAERGLRDVELEILSMKREAARREVALVWAQGGVPGLEEEEQP